MERVIVFLDFQNVYSRARDYFCTHGAPHWEGQTDCLTLGQRIIANGPPGRELLQVRAYRGRPASGKDPKGYTAHRRQSARLEKAGGGKVHMVHRMLRYPSGFPAEKPEEKGIDVALAVDFVMMAVHGNYDVGILMSTDTDLVPALEAVCGLQNGTTGYPRCEVAAWRDPAGNSRRLDVRERNITCRWLDQANYALVADPTDYNLR